MLSTAQNMNNHGELFRKEADRKECVRKKREFGWEAPDGKVVSGKPRAKRVSRKGGEAQQGWVADWQGFLRAEGLGWCPAGGPGWTHHVTPEHRCTGAESTAPASAGKELAPETGHS